MLIQWYRMSIQLEPCSMLLFVWCTVYMFSYHIIFVCFSKHSIALCVESWNSMTRILWHARHCIICAEMYDMYNMYVDSWFAGYMFRITRTFFILLYASMISKWNLIVHEPTQPINQVLLPSIAISKFVCTSIGCGRLLGSRFLKL